MKPKLKHRIEFHSQVKEDLGGGRFEQKFTPVFSVWGELKPLNSNEKLTQQKLSVTADYKLTIRQSSEVLRDVNNSSIVVYQDRKYKIVSGLENYEIDNRFLTLKLRRSDGEN